MKNILLVNPRYEMETLRVSDEAHIASKADNMPLGLATVAALTPQDHFNVQIWDEFVRGPVEENEQLLDGKYDLVGVTSTRVTLLRAIDVASFFKKREILTVVGGPGVSGSPDRCRENFDVLIIGEAELIWPQFLQEWLEGKEKNEYRQIEKPDMSLSPMPRWDSIERDVHLYSMGSVQTTRGCPYDCEFCDVVYLNGRRQRHKAVERVLDEVRVLQKLGVSTVYFADDNLIGNHSYAKKLLRKLIPMNNALSKPLRFATQASIDVSRDDELLELLADANFYEMLIGIESPNAASLKEMGKYNNLKGDLVEEIRNILSYGLSVRGALISGFDNDDRDIFDKQIAFIEKSYLPSVSLHMLNAPIGTRLWRRMREEDRVIDVFKITDKVTRRIISNILPKRMTRVELMEGFKRLYARVFSWESFEKRMIGFVSLSKRAPKVKPEEVSIEELMKLGPSWQLDEKACKAMERIFSYTEKNAPYLLARVKALVIQFTKYSGTARNLIPKIDRQIQLETSGSLTFELDTRPVTIPQGFDKSYRKIFPDIYRRVFLNLKDKEKMAECLMEVFVEFFVSEDGFTTYQDYHTSLLEEIADRTCARMNGEKWMNFKAVVESDTPVPDLGRSRLHEEILKSVEQELIKLAQVKSIPPQAA